MKNSLGSVRPLSTLDPPRLLGEFRVLGLEEGELPVGDFDGLVDGEPPVDGDGDGDGSLIETDAGTLASEAMHDPPYLQMHDDPPYSQLTALEGLEGLERYPMTLYE